MGDTSIGTTISVSAALPATENDTGYEALTFTEILGVVSIGEKGDDAEDVTLSLVKTGRQEHSIGTIDGGILAVGCKELAADGGQVIIKAGMHSDVDHSFQIVDSVTGASQYFFGRIANGKKTEKTASAYEGYNFEIRINSDTIEVAA